MGDEVLRNVGRLVLGKVRATDSAARFGGEELAIILPQTNIAGAAELAERLRKMIADATHTLGGVSIQKTASLGVASFDGTDPPIGPEELVKRADQALYKAKQGGRDRVVAWEAP